MKPSILKTFVFLCVLLCCVFFTGTGCYFANNTTTINDVNNILLNEWDIKLPEAAKLLYSQSRIGFPSDGVKYYVIEFEEEPNDLIEDFSCVSDGDFESGIEKNLSHLTNESGKEIPSKYYPDWETDYCWKQTKNDETLNYLNLFYYPENLELYILIVYM